MLSRADIVIAIQENEKRYFNNILDSNHYIITIGHHVKLNKPANDRNIHRKLLFIGTAIETNIDGMNRFVQNILPDLRKEMPLLELIVVGNICDRISDSPGCIKLDEIKEIDRIYEDADIVIAPIFFGMGLKTKVVEALGYGKPVIATTHASEGLEKLTKIKNSPLITANTHKEFTKKIIKTLTDGKYAKRSKNAYIYAKKYNKEIEKQIKQILDKTQKYRRR
jgi:glycosyltransferase involved in cell wall biosynthesis